MMDERWTYLDLGEVVDADNVEITICSLPVENDAIGELIAAAPQMADALRPFLAVMADIGETEDDADHFRNARRDYARAPAITVGDVRCAAAALRQALGQGEGQ